MIADYVMRCQVYRDACWQSLWCYGDKYYGYIQCIRVDTVYNGVMMAFARVVYII